MEKNPVKIAVTGGAGQIAYSLLFRIASGELLGNDQPIELSILELSQSMSALQGVVMELEDSCFPLLSKITTTSKAEEAFSEVDIAILVGSKPRGPGMERKDLLQANGKIFVEQGKALNKAAKKDAIVFVVGNPCNTNCLIAMHHAPTLKKENFHAMTRLDQNRAAFQLAAKANTSVAEVKNIIIWGNHSSTQVPDFLHASIKDKKATDIIKDHVWLRKDFIKMIQQRGAKIIEARGKSSAASASSAIIDGINDLFIPKKNLFSSAVFSEKNPYGVDKELVFSFPLQCKRAKEWEFVNGLQWDDFLAEKIKITEKELIEERDLVKSFL